MLDRETLTKLGDVAGRLLRLVDDRIDAGDRAGALAAGDAADALLAVLDLDCLRFSEGRSA